MEPKTGDFYSADVAAFRIRIMRREVSKRRFVVGFETLWATLADLLTKHLAGVC
jgi:hypothetical protein